MELINKEKLMASIMDAELDQCQSEKTDEELCEIIERQSTVEAIPIEVLRDIRQEIDKYLYDNEFGSAYRADVASIIDKHI